MLIPLSDPVWTRLYGAYGVQDVPGALASLEKGWSSEIASPLFWDMLFHQEDVYPVTYAALPWIWHLSKRIEPPDIETLYFLSMVLMCSQRRDGPRAKYYGLSLNPAEHVKSWLPATLTRDDMPILAKLEDWLTRHIDQIVTACLKAVPPGKSSIAATLCFGFCALRGGSGAQTLIGLWGDDHELEFIREEVTLAARDIQTINELLDRLSEESSALSRFLERYLRDI